MEWVGTTGFLAHVTTATSRSELLSLCAAPPRWRERFPGPWRSPQLRLASICRAIEFAVAAESNGARGRAVFYFDVAYREMESLTNDRRARDAIDTVFGRTDLASTAARELLLGAHIGFLKGYLAAAPEAPPEHRAFEHATWAERAMSLASLDPDEESAALVWLRHLRARAMQGARKHDEALGLMEEGLSRSSPAYFKDAYIEAVYERAIGTLPEGAATEQRLDAAPLAEAVARLYAVLDKLDDRALALLRLGELSRRQVDGAAAAQSLGGRVALLQRAVDADPFNLQAYAIDTPSRLALAEAQEQMARLEEQAAAEGKVLNEQGNVLKRDIMHGFDEARGYLRSEESSRVRQMWQKTWAVELWSRLGLPRAPGWEKRAGALTDALGRALVRSDLDAPAFAQTFAEEVRQTADLEGIDAAALAARLVDIQHVAEPPPTPVDPIEPQTIEKVRPLSAAEHVKSSGEDLADWLFSHRGTATRWTMAAAIALVASAAVLTSYNAYAQWGRQELFTRVMSAARDRQYTEVTELASQYLERKPLNSRRELDEAVEQAYAEALVHLFAASFAEPPPVVIRAAERYRELVPHAQEERR
jgi:hypothetical protein